MLRLLFAALLGVSALAGQASSQPPIELSVRHPAHITRMLGVEHLVHELWINNRAAAAVTLQTVAVLSESQMLAQYQEAELPRHIGRPGLARNHPTPLVLEPAQEAVVYFWVRLDPKAAPPTRVDHRVEIALAGPASPALSTARGGATGVVPAEESEVLDAPLRGPGWVAVYEPEMQGGHRTAIYTTDGSPRIPGRFAIDWIRLPSGATRMDPSSRPPDWNGFGAEVFAVKDARVAAAVDGQPDAGETGKPRVAITRDNAAGNYVSLDLGNGRFAFYEHLQEGSVVVKAGDRVSRGQLIARLGSSGSVSSGPHLHFHVSNANSPLAAEGVPFLLRAFLVRGAFASITAFVNGDAAATNASHVLAERSVERPAPNSIVDFPAQK